MIDGRKPCDFTSCIRLSASSFCFCSLSDIASFAASSSCEILSARACEVEDEVLAPAVAPLPSLHESTALTNSCEAKQIEKTQ